jgi:hypothetical protein
MKYKELDKKIQNQINGIISQYIDAYIRKHKVWTPLQMFEFFYEKLKKDILDWKIFLKEKPKMYWQNEKSLDWLDSAEGREFSIERFEKKYKNDIKVASRKSPLVDRVRFGYKWDESNFFDINYGLHLKYSFIQTKDFEKLEYKPWSIQHVESELSDKYNTNLKTCLKALSTSHLEKLFVNYWLENYYKDKNNSAIIPEVCGFREMFYYHKWNDGIYGKYEEIPASNVDSYNKIENVNYRYDFLIANFEKQKAALVELDGFEYHKSRKDQTIDSIKRNKASNYNISLLTFTSKRLLENIDAVFNEIDDYLK